jgi:CheY-like chemotaxis protein
MHHPLWGEPEDEMGTEGGQNEASTEREEFLASLRDALSRLYDAEYLRASPLASLAGVANHFDTATLLRDILTDAIESLKPADATPSESPLWLIYDSLVCCYVQQLGQRATADQLGISIRQLRREQHTALESLADRLWQQFGVGASQRSLAPRGTGQAAAATTGGITGEELAWLKDHPSEEPTDLNRVLSIVFELARPLAAQHEVALKHSLADSLPKLAVHPVALNQMLLSLLSVAIPAAAPHTTVHLTAEPLRWDVVIHVISPESRADGRPLSGDDRANLETARHLADMFGGRLEATGGAGGAFAASLTLPALVRLPVLVLDDNRDTLQLFQRYASGTRYRLICLHSPNEALEMVGKVLPEIIVLDVMMPQIDGWQVLARLRHHPAAAEVPIVVCTILAQEQLALSLGASSFLRKPVTRQAFLTALDQQAGVRETASR